MVVWLLIVKGNYRRVEKIFLIASALYLAYVASGIMARPPWADVLKATVTPTFHFEAGYVTIFVTDHRHDDRSLDAVLPAGLDRG